MRRFVMVRNTDVTGISGTGLVVWGLQFPDGHVVYRWNSATATTCVADKIEDVVTIHGHNGATRLVWIDSEEQAGAWAAEGSRVSPAA